MKAAAKSKSVALTAAVLLLVLAVVVVFALLRQQFSGGPGFFAQNEAYIAAETGTEISVSLTYFGNDYPTSEQLLGCTIPGAEDIVEVSGIDIYEIDSGSTKASCSADISLSFTGSGECDVQYLVFEYPDASQTYRIGDWHFDVYEPGQTIALDSYSTMYANELDDAFPYRYFFEESLNTDDNVYIEYDNEAGRAQLTPEGQELSGKIELQESEHPLRIIRPRIVVERDGHELTAYTFGVLQCGYLNFDEDDYEASRNLSRS